MEKQEILKELKNSLEVTWLKRKFLIHTPIYCAAGAVFAPFCLAAYLKEVWLIALLGILIALVLIFVSFLWRFQKIFRHVEHYRFYQTTFGRPNTCRTEYRSYFRITLEDQHGRQFKVNTHRIFHSWGIAGPKPKDYVNRSVTVAYNEETGEVVVIG